MTKLKCTSTVGVTRLVLLHKDQIKGHNVKVIPPADANIGIDIR